MKVVIENHIPYIKGLLEPWAQVEYLPAAEITPHAVRDAQALLVRTRTRCDAALLEGSSVEFIGTATIGTDHIDLEYCRRRGIAVSNAPGCNAPAVAQWVFASIATWMRERGVTAASALRLGVVGVGHVGSIVARWGLQLGFQVVLNDPPLGLDASVDDCDIITFHTPLTRDGQWPTHHLCDAAMLARASRCRLILNASRGAVCDNGALLAWHGDIALDCWENEPDINPELLQKTIVATPHIAGYSIEGKQRGTATIVGAFNDHFHTAAPVNMPQAPLKGGSTVTLSAILASYNPLHDTTALRAALDDGDIATRFEALRNNYPLRPELQ